MAAVSPLIAASATSLRPADNAAIDIQPTVRNPEAKIRSFLVFTGFRASRCCRRCCRDGYRTYQERSTADFQWVLFLMDRPDAFRPCDFRWRLRPECEERR